MEKLSARKKLFLQVLGFFIGILIGGMLVFNVLFLSKVLPHAGF